MSEHERERQHKPTVTPPPRKQTVQSHEPETKRALEKFEGWRIAFAIVGAIGVVGAIYWLTGQLFLIGWLGRLLGRLLW